MRRNIIVFFLLMYSVTALGSKLDKGFEALNMFNYFEAKKIFEKSLKKKTAGASYGLCKVYDAEKSPFFNVDTAFKFILICDSAFSVASDKERSKLELLGIDSASILYEKKFLATFFFAKATDINTLVAYESFIQNHPNAAELPEAIKLRNHAAYLLALNSNSIDGWINFLDNYPNSNDFLSAKKELQILEYNVMTQKGDAESFRLFVAKYPNNPYVNDAQEMLYQMYTQDKKLESYEKFISENPSNKNVEKAWIQVYKIRINKFSPPQIYEFMIDYPDFPKKKLLRDDLTLSITPIYPAQKENLWGFVDTTGNWMIKPQFSWASQFHEGKAIVGFMGKSVFIDKHGALIFKHLFDDAENFNELLAIVEVEDLYGVINFLGDTIIPIVYEELGDFSEGLIYAGNEDGYGYYSTNGDLIIPFQYSNAFDFIGGYAIVKSDSGYGVINDSGRVVIPLRYEAVLPDSNFCIVKNNGDFGILTYTGDTLVSFVYDVIGGFSNNRAIAAKGNRFQYINKTGEIAFTEEFGFNDLSLNYSAFSGGYAKVIVKEKVGIINREGTRVYPAIFTDIGEYGSELTAINKGGLWGYSNADVKLIIPYQYKFAKAFNYGFAVVENDTSQALINGDNEIIIPFDYDRITQLDSTLLLVEKNNLFGILTYANDTVLEVKYESIEWLSKEVLMIRTSGSMALYDIAGKKFIYKEDDN